MPSKDPGSQNERQRGHYRMRPVITAQCRAMRQNVPYQEVVSCSFLPWFPKNLSFLPFRPLHVLILNAAVQERYYCRSDDNFEHTFAVNHLAHFYLTLLLTPTLIKSAPSRVIVVTSESHRL